MARRNLQRLAGITEYRTRSAQRTPREGRRAKVGVKEAAMVVFVKSKNAKGRPVGALTFIVFFKMPQWEGTFEPTTLD